MTSPIIGITTGRQADDAGEPWVQVTEAYVRAILHAGGLPILLPVGLAGERLREIQARLSGVLLTGGDDIDPALFHGEPHPKVAGVDPGRDDLELSLARWATDSGVPFLGICRGCQVVNVALGGTLFTDIPDQVPGALRHVHLKSEPRSRIAHDVSVEQDSCLAGIVGTRSLPANSSHHQSAKEIGAGLVVTAHAPDGVIEALELPGHPFGLAVQWHPEWLPGVTAHEAIFSAFIQAAAKNQISD
jgi:putative glutamine amidotransferase